MIKTKRGRKKTVADLETHALKLIILTLNISRCSSRWGADRQTSEAVMTVGSHSKEPFSPGEIPPPQTIKSFSSLHGDTTKLFIYPLSQDDSGTKVRAELNFQTFE